VAAFSSFIILPSAFEMSLVTGLRAERYDPAGLGCYERRSFGRVALPGNVTLSFNQPLNRQTWVFHPCYEPVIATFAAL
jgi:hypothetical protein